MSSVQTFTQTYTVTQADVVWVAGQVYQELLQFQLLYPDLITDTIIEDFTHAVRVFLRHDVINRAEMVIAHRSADNHYHCDDQRVFVFNHDHRKGRAGFEQPIAKAKPVRPESKVQCFMAFNDVIKKMSREDQRKILSGTSWEDRIPGTSSGYYVTYDNELTATGQAWSRDLGVTRWQ